MIEYLVTYLGVTSHEATAQMNAMAAEGWRFVAVVEGMGVIMAREQRPPVMVEKGTTVIFADGSMGPLPVWDGRP